MLIVENVEKSFGRTQILKDLSFNLRRGEIAGFVGLNGSGKTTTMRCILGIASITNGAIYESLDSNHRIEIDKNAIGYMPEERGLYQNETVFENLMFIGRLRGLSKLDATAIINNLLEKLAISGYSWTKVRFLSLGNQQRVQLLAALIPQPRYLILDEPFNGLDPRGIVEVAQYLEEIASIGVGVLLSTHVLAHIEKLCDRALLLENGKIVSIFTNKTELRNEEGTSLSGYYFKND